MELLKQWYQRYFSDPQALILLFLLALIFLVVLTMISGARELLTVLRIDAATGGELHLSQILGPPLELLELPYELERSASG